MGKRGVLENLIGRTIGPCEVTESVKEVKRSWQVMGHNPRLERDEALNIFKPGQGRKREEQFLKKGKRAAKRGRRKNLPVVYYAGIDENTGLAYQAYQPIINPSGDFEDEINAGIKFSLEEILHRMAGAINGVINIQIDEDIHGDIKLANIKKNVGDGETYILDEGGRLFSQHEYPGDIPALANCFAVLFEHCSEQVPNKLKQIVRTASEGDYNLITDFKKAVDSYRWWNKGISPLQIGPKITRGNFFRVGLAALALAGAGSLGLGHLNYRNSIDYVVEQIEQIGVSDYEKIDPLFGELVKRIYTEKIYHWIERDKIPEGNFLWVTWDNGDSAPATSEDWIAGKTILLIGQGTKITGDERFRDWALNKLREIRLPEKEELLEQVKRDIRLFRFFDSYAWAYEITGDSYYRKAALKVVDALASFRYNENGFFQSNGVLIDGVNVDEDYNRIHADTMTTLLPFLWWGYKETGKYYDKITSHINNIIRGNIRDDGSVSEFAKFNERTGEYDIKKNYYGHNPDSCFARTQARVFLGLIEAYENAEKSEKSVFLHWAERAGNFIIENQSRDFVSYYDYYFNNLDREIIDIPKDTHATTIEISGLTKIAEVTGEERYKEATSQRKQVLSVNYLSSDQNKFGIISNACINPKNNYRNCFSTNSDIYFLQKPRLN